MPVTLTRKNVTELAGVFATPGSGKMSYLQRLDAIAHALGLPNQAVMMASLNAAEATPRPAPSPAVEASAAAKPLTMVIAFGQDLSRAFDSNEPIDKDTGGSLVHKTFASQAEMSAYITGMEDMEGWLDSTVVAQSGTDPRNTLNAELLEALENDPGLDVEEWHNARVKAFLDDEMDDEDMQGPRA